MSNFKFLLSEPGFASFADVAMAAEKILHIDPAASILNCRRAMEFAVKWMYSVDKELEMPYQDNLQSLMTREEFRQIVGQDIYARMDYIRVKGNNVAHNTGKASEAAAMLCLQNLHIFLDFVAYCYADTYEETKFDSALVPTGERIATASVIFPVLWAAVLPFLRIKSIRCQVSCPTMARNSSRDMRLCKLS